MRTLATICCVTLVLECAFAQAKTGIADDPREQASKITQSVDRRGGVISVIGGDGDLAVALAKQGEFTVHCIQPDEQARDAVRRRADAAGMGGTISAVVANRIDRLPYTAELLNIVVVENWPRLKQQGLSASELARVIAPLGHVVLKATGNLTDPTQDPTQELNQAGLKTVDTPGAETPWLNFRKPYPETIDQWTHYLHGPDGNPVAADEVVGPPRHYQWISGPDWLKSHETVSSITTMVTAQGRLFYIEDKGPTSLAGQHELPDKWFLVARDAFNGRFLWEVPIRRWGWREWKSSWFSPRPGDVPLNIQKKLVADGDNAFVTLGYHAPVSMLDARTGKIKQTYSETDPTLEILHHDGTLILSVLSDDERIKLVAVDASSGNVLWKTKEAYGGTEVDYYRWRAMRGRIEPADIDPTLNTATDGESIALIDRDNVVCLDYETGEERWRGEFPLEEADLRAGGVQTEGNLWTGTMIVTDGVVLHASPHKLAAFSASSGDILWEAPKAYIGHLWFEWKDVFVTGGLVWTWEGELERSSLERGNGRSNYPRRVMGYDLHTGKTERVVDLGYIFKTHHHHRCYRNKATSHYILASRRGTEYVDLKGGEHTVHNWVRGTCHMGMMPANGFQYAPPHPCRCYDEEKIKSLNALAPLRRDELPGNGSPSNERTVKGPAFGKAKGLAAEQADWPTFRGDNQRTGSVDTQFPRTASQVWQRRLAGRISSPIAVGDKVYVSEVDACRVVCLDAGTGSELWSYTAGSRVDSPPTYYKGTVIFGCSDGRVYCLDAAEGNAAWIFTAAPAERLIAVEGHLESAWPVHGSVLVKEGTVYVACGRSSQLDGGLYLYALDAISGQVKNEQRLAGPDYKTTSGGRIEVWEEKTSPAMMPSDDEFGENYRLPQGVLPDIMACEGEKLYMRSRAFDMQLQPTSGKPAMLPVGGYLDENYFKRMPWTYLGNYARMLVRHGDSAVYIRMFDSLRGLDPTVYFTPGKKGYLLFAVEGINETRGKPRRTWSNRIPVRVQAMVLASGRILAAGPPDLMDLDAFEGKAGGELQIIDAASGEKLSENTLQSPPVFNGAAAARGKLFISCEDGSVVCFGEKE
ncbi:MAG: PQQ-binding-like beta-propeller repeat protein [Pirellulaceae bacterium]